MTYSTRTAASGIIGGAFFGLLAFALPAGAQQLEHQEGLQPQPELDARVMTTIERCEEVASSCRADIDSAEGTLVFPSVLSVDLVVGGTGGHGALIEGGKIAGYYDLGEASAGAQIGIDDASYVFTIHDAATLEQLGEGGKWDVGAEANVTVVEADATAAAQSGGTRIYVFDAEGLNAGVDISVLKIWKQKDD